MSEIAATEERATGKNGNRKNGQRKIGQPENSATTNGPVRKRAIFGCRFCRDSAGLLCGSVKCQM